MTCHDELESLGYRVSHDQTPRLAGLCLLVQLSKGRAGLPDAPCLLLALAFLC